MAYSGSIIAALPVQMLRSLCRAQVEGQTRGFKGASRAYRKIGECQCTAACRFNICTAKTRPRDQPSPSTGTHCFAGEAECGLECDDVFMGTMQKQVKCRTYPPAEISPPFPTLLQLFRRVCDRV